MLLALGSMAPDIDAGDDFADDPNDAVVLAAGGKAATGRIAPARDLDWFTFTPAAGATYSFETTAGNIALELYAADGQTRLAPELAAPFSYTFPGNRNRAAAFVRVSGSDTCSTGDYAFTVTQRAADDHGNAMSAVRAGDQLGDSPAVLHAPIPGTIDYPGDRDFFRFTATAGHAYEMAVSGNEAGVFCTVYDSAGALLVSGASGRLIAPASPATTDYFIGVQASGTGPYALTIRPEAPVNLAPVGVSVGSAGNPVAADPGETFQVRVTLRNDSNADWCARSGLPLRIRLSTDEILEPADPVAIPAAPPAAWAPVSMDLSHGWDWQEAQLTIPFAGRYRLRGICTNPSDALAFVRLQLDELALRAPGSTTPLWYEGFEYAGRWGNAGWQADLGDAPAFLDTLGIRQGYYAGSAAAPPAAPAIPRSRPGSTPARSASASPSSPSPSTPAGTWSRSPSSP